jgi:hypothetical protein
MGEKASAFVVISEMATAKLGRFPEWGFGAILRSSEPQGRP